MKRTKSKLIKGEKGQALLIVLVLMLVGGLIIAPLLSHIGTGLKTGKEVYEERTGLFYAADSGIEDALWQIKHEALPDLFAGYNQYDYTTVYPHSLPSQVNAKTVDYTLQNIWVPNDPSTPGSSVANIAQYGNTTGQLPPAPSLIITGGPSGTSATKYQIGIIYSYGTEGPDALKVQSIGIWLPPGFNYAGNCSLASDTDTAPYSTPATPQPYKSGKVVVWTFGSLSLSKFPPTTSGSPMAKSFTFDFTGPAGQTPNCVSWINTTGCEAYGITYAWDADKKVYGITSTATDPGPGATTGKQTIVDAYLIKTETRQMGTAIPGDYVAIGNSLMMPDPNNGPSDDWRSRLLKESSATIQDSSAANPGYIPAGATVEGAYLYWSGWIDRYYWKATTTTSHGHTTTTWSWVPSTDNGTGGITELNYNNYSSDPSQLIANAKVNTVSFGGGGVTQDITANQWAVYPKMNDSTPPGVENCWYYTCLYDVKDLVKQPVENAIKSAGGTYTFTLGHASQGTTTVINQTRPDYDGLPNGTTDGKYYSFNLYNSSGSTVVGYTGYPLGTPAHMLPSPPGESDYQPRYHASYAGWSLVIIYSSPGTQGHQLYLYDIKNPNFTFKESFGSDVRCDMDFDGDGNPGGKVSGFLVPQPITGETVAARITCFVGEGDVTNTGDFIAFNAPSQYWSYPADLNIPNTYKLWDGITCTSNSSTSPNNVWNSQFLPLTSASGVDIDTFYIPWQTGGAVPYGNPNFNGLLHPGNTSVQINLPSPNDGITLSYIILSFRSSVTYGGTISYLVRG